MTDREEVRQRFAEEIKYRAQVFSWLHDNPSRRRQTERLLQAFASVPRERFLGEGPWRIRSEIVLDYESTENADPIHLYHDVLVAIDESRALDNGLPSLWARLFEALEIEMGERVVQIGCGTGYYSAILSELVGINGAILAIDCDDRFVRAAKRNLQERSNVEVIQRDGCRSDVGPADVIVVHAGVTHPHPLWLDSLRPNGRLIVPLTTDDRQGTLFKIKRLTAGYQAEALRRIEIFPCKGRGTADETVTRWWEAISSVRSLRRDEHRKGDDCWLHGEEYCLSRNEVTGDS